MDSSTRLCAVIGNPVGHSLSPALHNAAFQALGLNYVYLAFRIEDVACFMSGMRAMNGFRGASVTIPHKQAVISLLDHIDPEAARVGSVNTIVAEDGRLTGYSTDGAGALRAMEEEGITVADKRVLFLGSGGAVRAVAFACAGEGRAAGVTILSRKAENATGLASEIETATGVPVVAGGLDAGLRDDIQSHDVLIHGTPVGMHPHEDASCVPAEWLHPGIAVFDMVYRPLRTRLIHDAIAAGCRATLGHGMLLHQAMVQFELWTGQPAPAGVMREALLKALGG